MQTAINANCVTEVWVAAGTYYPTPAVGGSGDRYKAFKMKKGVAIYGGFAGNELTLNARDIAAILRAKKNQLEIGYIEEWVAQLGLGSVWKELLDSTT